MYKINRLPETIDIGYTGEHQFREIQIDMTPWMELMPAGVPSIVHIRPGETKDDAYKAETTFENNILTWKISMSDLGSEDGRGIAQVWLEDVTGLTVNHRGKSTRFFTVVCGSAGEADAIPASQTNWEGKLALKVDKTSIANNLTTTEEGKVLDARQGKALNDSKVDKSSIVNNLDATEEGGVLDARQGKALDDKKVDIHTVQEAGKFLQTDENGDAVWGGPASPTDIGNAVTTWLEANIPTGTTVVVDKSLSTDSAAADAQIAGRAFKANKGSLEKATEQIIGTKALVFVPGYYRVYSDNTVVDTSAPEISNTTSKTMVTALCPCAEGDVFTIRAYGGAAAAAAYGFLNSSKQGISRGTTNALYEGNVTAPANAAYFIVNNNLTNNSTDYYAYKGVKIIKKVENAQECIDDALNGLAERKTWIYNESNTHPTLWRTGYYSSSGFNSSTRYITTDARFGPLNSGCDTLIAKSFDPKWGIEVVEYNRSGQYTETYGSVSNKTNVVRVRVRPGYTYRLNQGLFPTNKASSFLTRDNIAKTGLWFIKSATSEQDTDPKSDFTEETVKSCSFGNVSVYSFDKSEMMLYKVEDNEIIESKVVTGSDYILCDSSYLYNLQIENQYNETVYHIYFYDQNKNITWSILDYTDSNGRKNCFTPEALKAINGFQFANLTTGYYMRIAIEQTNTSGTTPHLYVWNKAKFGMHMVATHGSYIDNSFVSLPSGGESLISVTKEIGFLMAKPGYTFIGMRVLQDNGYYSTPDNSSFTFPCQCVSLSGWTGWSHSKNLIIVKNYNYSTGTYDAEPVAGDISDYVCALPISSKEGIIINSNAIGKSKLIANAIADVMAVAWECKKTTENWAGHTYKQGVTYHGVPYRSDWQNAAYFGWHVTAHTFVNAANDPDSIFYEGAPTGGTLKPGPYYGLVCSSFGTLVSFFNYPSTNYGFLSDPNYVINVANDPEVGSLISNGNGHCMILVLKTNGADDIGHAIIGESSGDFTRYHAFYSNYKSADLARGSDGNADIRNYIYHVNMKEDLNVQICLNIKDYSITNGSARPYKGDGSVYTSKEDVKINIKDSSASRLYYQKFTGTFSRGRPSGSLTASGDPQYISITPGDTSAVLRTKTVNGSYTGVELEHGAVYGVWASVDSGQTTAPENTEYFEWHDLAQEPITYSYVDGVLVTDDEFWYARGFGKNYVNPIRGNNGGMISIPYEKPKKSMDGSTTAEHSDYSKYAEKFVINTSHQMFFYRKGKLGNYLAAGTIEEPGPDPD